MIGYENAKAIAIARYGGAGVSGQIDFAIDLLRLSRLALSSGREISETDGFMIANVLDFAGDILCDCNPDISATESR